MSEAQRKPVEPGCDGSLWCPIPEHHEVVVRGRERRFSHVRLTPGQKETLRDRRMKAMKKEVPA